MVAAAADDRSTPDILRRIIARKREEVAERSARTDLATLRRRADDMPERRPFVDALIGRAASGEAAIIAEIKRASPSKGVIREQFNPAAIARSYAAAGATCLSVLTDVDFFQGSDQALIDARAATQLPVLRKDFLVDAYQVVEARCLGADCVLLIVSALTQPELTDLYGLAQQIGLDVLIEVHNGEELERAILLRPRLLGINNRDLHSFHTSLQVTFDLQSRVPAEELLVTESGLNTRADVQALRGRGIHAFLIGEAFMRAADPGAALQALFADS